MPPNNPMTEGEALAVLRRLKDALPDVGLNGWMEGVHAVDVAISALTAHTAASGGQGQPECVCCEDCGTEVEAYCPKCDPPAAVPAGALTDEAIERALDTRLGLDRSLRQLIRGDTAAVGYGKTDVVRALLAALIPKGAE